MAAQVMLEHAKRPLLLGIGGGGDIVGALAMGEACRLRHGARPVLGGVSWERRPVDPRPGPRRAQEIENARVLSACVLLAGPDTRAGEIRFAESRVAGLLGEPTVLVDANCGPAQLAEGLTRASQTLGCDLVVFVDVGGDAIAAGTEPGLGSPLCDAVLLAAAAQMSEPPVLGAVLGAGCDGELTLCEVRSRLDELEAVGALAGSWTLREAELAPAEAAVKEVPTEASAMALRAARGETGEVAIRGGRRTVTLDPMAAQVYLFDPALAASEDATPLAAAVLDARDLDHANALLNARGLSTELDYERRSARNL